MWCGGHEGLWDSPIAGRQTGWHPKCSFFILETAVVSVTTLAANEVWVRSGGGGLERRLMGLNMINCCRIGGGSWPWTVNTIPNPAAHWSATSPAQIYILTLPPLRIHSIFYLFSSCQRVVWEVPVNSLHSKGILCYICQFHKWDFTSTK